MKYRGHTFELVKEESINKIKCTCCKIAPIEININMDKIDDKINNQPIIHKMIKFGLPGHFLGYLKGCNRDKSNIVHLSDFCIYTTNGIKHFPDKNGLEKSITTAILKHETIHFIISNGKYIDKLLENLKTIVSTKL